MPVLNIKNQMCNLSKRTLGTKSVFNLKKKRKVELLKHDFS